MDLVVNTEIGLDYINCVIKRLWCTCNPYWDQPGNPSCLFSLQCLHLISKHNVLQSKGFCLFDLMLYIHGKQLRSCWDGQLLHHTVPGQAFAGSLPVLSAHSFTSN